MPDYLIDTNHAGRLMANDPALVERLRLSEAAGDVFTVTLPGEHKLRTTCSLVVGPHSVSVNAFVSRHPDENVAGVHRWLLERNRRLFGLY